ncbi:hypothetical protein BGX21_003377, partial [Mortierella sp. AD011]
MYKPTKKELGHVTPGHCSARYDITLDYHAFTANAKAKMEEERTSKNNTKWDFRC